LRLVYRFYRIISWLRYRLARRFTAAGWMVLGTGKCLRIKLTGRPEGLHEGEPTKIVAAPATTPLGTDAWKHSF
jgi:hypothetical protein